MILLAGEITSRAAVDYQKVVRDTIRHIGYDDSSKGTGGAQTPPKSALGAARIPPRPPLEQHRTPNPKINPWSGTLITSPRLKSAL